MSATDELRRMLDERGVEYDVKDLSNIKFFHDTRWNANGVRWCYTEFVGATTCLTMCNEWKDCTPEQAIAATLGSGTLTAEQVREAVEASTWAETSTLFEFGDSSWQAIADELNAELGSGTCHMSYIDEYETASGEEEYLCECSECGYRRWESACDLPLFCSKCGRKVKR